MREIFYAVLTLTLLTACAGTSRLPPKTAADLRRSRVVAGFYNLDPRIVYEEQAYRVFWLQTNRHEVTFAGLWDVDVDLGKVFVAKLDDVVHEVLPLYEDLELAEGLKATIRAQRGAPPAEAAQLTLTGEQLKALRSAQVKYLILLCAGAFNVQSHTIAGVAFLFVPIELVVYDVTSGQQIFSELFQIGGTVPHKETVREIEADGMAQLRAISSKSLVEASETRLSELLQTRRVNQ